MPSSTSTDTLSFPSAFSRNSDLARFRQVSRRMVGNRFVPIFARLGRELGLPRPRSTGKPVSVSRAACAEASNRREETVACESNNGVRVERRGKNEAGSANPQPRPWVDTRGGPCTWPTVEPHLVAVFLSSFVSADTFNDKQERAEQEPFAVLPRRGTDHRIYRGGTSAQPGRERRGGEGPRPDTDRGGEAG